MLSPDNIIWFMGYDTLGLILEQERKHWLLKTDKKKRIQDKKTGDMFQGQIDNLGSDIVIETEKLETKNDLIQTISFEHPSANKILSVSSSPFTSEDVNGLMFCRILSTNFQWKNGSDIQFKHYKMKLENCEECTLSLMKDELGSNSIDSIWLKTKTPPTLLMLDSNGVYSIEQQIKFNENITNVVFYYPLTKTLQPLGLTKENDGIYVTDTVNNDDFIGYPLYWFTCDQSNVPISNTTTTDTGHSGIRMSSSNLSSDIYPRYPYNLNEWDGLPTWMNNMTEDMVPQHLSIYSIHDTPLSNSDIPGSKQTAALLLDPGLIKADNEDRVLTNDERGRVYLLSNDKAIYENNNMTDYPKPARTVARICDIPTSAIQLSGIHDIAPTSVVDKKYVRSEASFSIEDKNRLYNILGNRWIKPTDLDSKGNPLTDNPIQDNKYIFKNPSLLNEVDLINHNDYRLYENINPMVNPSDVYLSNIIDSGTGYSEDDIGVVIVGGFAFHYTITDVDENGHVQDLIISPATSEIDISLSNFDLMDDKTGITNTYGTSPLTGSGKGLRLRFIIKNYEKISPYKGEIFEGLFAIVKENDGLWLYDYIINDNSKTFPKEGNWVKKIMISESEQSVSPLQSNRGISLTDAYMNSIIPSMRNIPVSIYKNGYEPTSLLALKTPTFINIIDKTKTPLVPPINDPNITHIDMCKFYCDGIMRLRASRKTEDSVISAIKANKKIHYDSYIFWKWESKNDINNLYFTCGIIHRSFNNFLTTDSTTTLPINELICNEYVNSNAGTTVVWDMDNIGVMMWVYNPIYQKHEIYNIDPSTQDLYVERRNITWSDIDIGNSKNGKSISLIENGKLAYNILTNNPIQTEGLNDNIVNPNPIYQQSDIYQLSDLTLGTLVSDISQEHQPMGNWQLVFPRVNSFRLTNIDDGREFTPIKMQMIKGSNIGKISNVTDSAGKNVNAKSIIVDETSEGLFLKIYNSETGNWEKI